MREKIVNNITVVGIYSVQLFIIWARSLGVPGWNISNVHDLRTHSDSLHSILRHLSSLNAISDEYLRIDGSLQNEGMLVGRETTADQTRHGMLLCLIYFGTWLLDKPIPLLAKTDAKKANGKKKSNSINQIFRFLMSTVHPDTFGGEKRLRSRKYTWSQPMSFASRIDSYYIFTWCYLCSARFFRNG